MLDTNVLTDLAHRPDGNAARQMERVGLRNTVISIVVASEVRFGLAKRSSERLRERMLRMLARIKTLPFESPADEHYAEIRNSLEVIGRPIGSNDLFIAAHARSRGMTLVTANIREFSRVPGLSIENWLE